MKKNTLSILSSNIGEYVGISLWEQEDNKSTYYDRKLDTQGVVPGHTMEEAKKAYEQKYGIRL